MSVQKQSKSVIVSSLICLILTACAGGEPTPAPTLPPSPIPEASATLTPTEVPTEWLYVALGTSEARCCGERSYPEYYADLIEQDLNVQVDLRNLSRDNQTTAKVLDTLAEEDVRELIREAQVVTLVVMMDDIYACPVGDTSCVEDILEKAKENFDAILQEIQALTGADHAIIRVQTFDNPFVNRWKERGDFDERKVTIDRLNQIILDVAGLYGIPVADVYHDFNGPNGDQDPSEKGYIAADDLHNNDAGQRRMAELLRDLGYEPLGER